MAHIARIYDYLLGGGNNFAVDREHAEHVCRALPGGIEGARANVRANRAFLVEAVRYLASEQGIRQFLDIGTGIPNNDNVHAVAQAVAPDTRVVYVDYDPIVLAYAQQLVGSTPEGATDYVQADLREPDTILKEAAGTLDFERPIAVMLLGVLSYVLDEEDPYGIVATLMKAVPSGSYLAVSHLASDIQETEMAELARRHNKPDPAETVELRNRTQVAMFFADLDLVGPGIVPVDLWRPHGAPTTLVPGDAKPIHAGLGRRR